MSRDPIAAAVADFQNAARDLQRTVMLNSAAFPRAARRAGSIPRRFADLAQRGEFEQLEAALPGALAAVAGLPGGGEAVQRLAEAALAVRQLTVEALAQGPQAKTTAAVAARARAVVDSAMEGLGPNPDKALQDAAAQAHEQIDQLQRRAPGESPTG